MRTINPAALASLVLLAAGLTACSATPAPGSGPASTGPGSTGPASSPATPAAAPAASPQASSSATAAPTISTAPLVPMQTATGGEFLSPSGNISCEIDDNQTAKTAYCETETPPQSVTMDTTGSYRTCSGDQCLSNAGEGTPTLAYGTSTGTGPFVCTSASTGITCTANGRGFQISTAGITAAP